jgi:nicotinamide riboside kinase
MHISISGTHATGKTSLMRVCEAAMVERYPQVRVDYIGEVARKVLAMGLPLNRDATMESYLRYWRMQLEAERTATAELVISDRSLVDSLAYLEASRIPEVPESAVGLLRELLWIESRFFDVYCLVPVEWGIHEDTVRPVDRRYQREVDEKLREILERYRLRVVEVSGPTHERARQVLELAGYGDAAAATG